MTGLGGTSQKDQCQQTQGRHRNSENSHEHGSIPPKVNAAGRAYELGSVLFRTRDPGCTHRHRCNGETPAHRNNNCSRNKPRIGSERERGTVGTAVRRLKPFRRTRSSEGEAPVHRGGWKTHQTTMKSLSRARHRSRSMSAEYRRVLSQSPSSNSPDNRDRCRQQGYPIQAALPPPHFWEPHNSSARDVRAAADSSSFCSRNVLSLKSRPGSLPFPGFLKQYESDSGGRSMLRNPSRERNSPREPGWSDRDGPEPSCRYCMCPKKGPQEVFRPLWKQVSRSERKLFLCSGSTVSRPNASSRLKARVPLAFFASAM